jgi:hypothetical protein
MHRKNNEIDVEKPPVFRQWKWWYFLLLGWLGLLIIFFYLVTEYVN